MLEDLSHSGWIFCLISDATDLICFFSSASCWAIYSSVTQYHLSVMAYKWLPVSHFPPDTQTHSTPVPLTHTAAPQGRVCVNIVTVPVSRYQIFHDKKQNPKQTKVYGPLKTYFMFNIVCYSLENKHGILSDIIRLFVSNICIWAYRYIFLLNKLNNKLVLLLHKDLCRTIECVSITVFSLS